MFGTTFETYECLPDPQQRKIRTLEVKLPRNILPYVQSIHPTTYFEQVRPLRSVIHSIADITDETSLDSSCATQITPKCLQDLYGIDSGVIKDATKTGILGVPGFLGQISQFADFDASLRTVPGKTKVETNFTYSILNGGSMAQSSRSNSVEANLDIQYTAPLVSPMRTHFYAVGKKGELIPDANQPDARNSQNEPFAEFFSHLLSLEDKT
jgi:tripeptidyl-peptidase-1